MKIKQTILKIIDFIEESNLLYKVIIVSCIFSYFVYHAIHGNNGYRAYLVIREKLTNKTEELNQLQQKVDRIKKQVNLLKNRSIDLDMLEERCLHILNYSDPNCIVIKTRNIK